MSKHYHKRKYASMPLSKNKIKALTITTYTNIDFIKKLICLMIPLSLQGLLQNVATTVDSLMLGVISKSAMTAASISVVFLNFQVMLLVAIGSALGAMLSRFWVKEDGKSMLKIYRLGIILAFLIGLLFFLLCTFIPTQIMSFYSNDIKVIDKGTIYLKIVGFAYLFKSINFVRERDLSIVGLEGKATICTLICNCLNIILNALLIYGIGIFPKLEIKGAALATLISAIIEFILVFFVIKMPSIKKQVISDSEEKIYREFFKRFATCALQLLAYMLGINFLTAAYGHLNPGIVAVFSVITTIGGWLAASRDGLQDSSIILMGETLAKCDREECIKKSKICEKIGAVAGLFFVGIFLLLTIIFSIKYIKNNEVELQLYVVLLIVSSINLYVGVLTTMIQGSTLIPGGDLIFNLFVDLGVALLYASPLLILGDKIINISLVLYVVLLKIDEIIKYPLIKYRSSKNIWIDNMIVESK